VPLLIKDSSWALFGFGAQGAGEPIRIVLVKKFWNLSILLPIIKTIFGKYVWAKC